VSSALIDGVSMICVTLNAPNDWQDHKNMLEYGFSKFECVDLADCGDYVLELDVINGQKTALIQAIQTGIEDEDKRNTMLALRLKNLKQKRELAA
jgi:D-alanyl-D-alanine carboxypeptidase